MATSSEDIPLTAETMVLYNMFYTTSRTNVTLHQGDKHSPVVYYGKSKILKTKPMYHVHEKSEDGPVLAFCHVPWASKTMSIGLGDGTDSSGQEMTRDRALCFRSDYHFKHESVVYDWRKDRSKIVATAYECLDDDGKVCATLLSGGAYNWKKGGELRIREDIDQDLAKLLIAGALGIWTLEALWYQSFFQAF